MTSKYHYTMSPRIGVLPCFCENEISKKTNDLGNKKFLFHDIYRGHPHVLPICKNYVRITNNAEWLTFISAKGIVGTNLLIRIFVIWVLEKTGA